MNFYVDSGGEIISVDAERIFQGSANANTLRFIGAFPSSAQVAVSYKLPLPSGIVTERQLLTFNKNLSGIQNESGTTFNVWEIGLGVKYVNGKYLPDYTVLENAGVVNVQFFITLSNENGEVVKQATARSSFVVERGNAPDIPPAPYDDYEGLLNQILAAVSAMGNNKVNKSGDTMTGSLTVNGLAGANPMRSITLSSQTGALEVFSLYDETGEAEEIRVFPDIIEYRAYSDYGTDNESLEHYYGYVLPKKSGVIALNVDLADLKNEISTKYAERIVLSINPQNYVLTAKLFAPGIVNAISVSSIDLPLESMVVNGRFDSTSEKIVLTLQNGNEIEIPVGNLIDGLVSQQTFDNFLATKGQPNGFAGLDANGKVPKEQLPAGSGGDGISAAEFEELLVESLTNPAEEWTDEDKASACETIGAANKKYVDAGFEAMGNNKVNKSGDTMTGSLTVGYVGEGENKDDTRAARMSGESGVFEVLDGKNKTEYNHGYIRELYGEKERSFLFPSSSGILARLEDINKAKEQLQDEMTELREEIVQDVIESGKGEIKDEITSAIITQEAGQSESLVMSQKAVTDLVADALGSGGTTEYETVDSVEEMTDTSKQYVLKSTGTIWQWKETTTEKEVTVRNDITSGYERGRLSSGGANSGDVKTHTLTPLIDITKAEYQGKTIQIHLEGNRYFSENVETYIMTAVFDTNKGTILGRAYSCLDRNAGLLGALDNAGATAVIHDTTSSTLTIPVPLVDDSDNTVGYLRFCGLGTVDGTVYITYTEKQTVTEETWTDTGVAFGGVGSIDTETLAKIAELNNEGTDPKTIKLLAKPVLDFYNASAYSDDDYTYSHLSNITHPCRADIPVPFNVKWNHNEEAMRTTVAVDTKAIGTNNFNSMITFEATGLDNFPIYNLLPNKTYYYKVTHVLADGSLVEAKSGNFTTSNETVRMLYIDGTQNVRDLGGWTGLNGKKVKYGKIIRGASFGDSSYHGLMLTGKGRLALAELKIQAELNLGAVDSETSIAPNVAYKKVYYTNYAIAITDETYRTMFKTLLEYIVSCLDGTLTVSGLSTVARNIYMHCQGGCDRTGTLSFLLLGLLGVSESDLAKEYELSSFSDVGFGRRRNTRKAVDGYDYAGMVEALKTYSGSTITDKFYNFAIACGVTAETITEFRNLMLE